MSDGLNRATLLGNLGQNPELRFAGNGNAVLNLRMVTNETYFDKNKEKQERADWHTITVWGKRAEGLNNILEQGMQVYVEGRIQTRSWETQNGEKRYSTEIVASDVIPIWSSKKDRNQDATYPERSRTYDNPSQGGDNDDMPF